MKFEVTNAEYEEQIKQSGKIPIYVFWHNRIFAGAWYFRKRGIVIMASQSFDGEYISRFIQRFGYGAARGSSSKGGLGALVEMIRLMKSGITTAFTIDGPRGPRYEAKSGACLLAKKTGNPILPLVIECEDFFEVNSWDKLQIPKPFARVRIIFGKPIRVSADAGEKVLEDKRLEMQNSLDELVKTGEQWRESKI